MALSQLIKSTTAANITDATAAGRALLATTNWQDKRRANAAALGLSEYWFTHFDGNGKVYVSGGGGGGAASTSYPSETGGVFKMGSSASAGGYTVAVGGDSAASAQVPVIANPSTQAWTMACRFKILDLTTATQHRIGIGPVNTVGYVALVINSTGVAKLDQGDGNVAITTTYQPAVDGYHTLRLEYTGSGSNLKAYIDDVLISTSTCLGTAASSFFCQSYNNGQAVNTQISFDAAFVGFALA